MSGLRIQPEAKADLKALIDQGGACKDAAVRILTFLQELQSKPEWLDELLTRKFENDDFNVDKFVSCWNEGLDVWRLSIFEFDFEAHKRFKLPYRVLYAWDIGSRCFRVLAIAHRDFDYKADHEITLRIQRQYDALGLQRARVFVPTNKHRSSRH